MLRDVPPSAVRVSDAALFLDLDGAIVPLADSPDEVRASPACRVVLRRAHDELNGRLAIVSGRTIDSVDEVVGEALPFVAGVHGLQRRSPVAGLVLEPAHARVADAAEVLQALARARAGLRVEPKGASVAIHYRAAPDAAAAVLEAAERLADASGLTIQKGNMVVELRTPGPDKGAALDRFMLELPFAGTCPIFIGDDLTDEAGFAAARAYGGFGLLVGEPRATLATGRLESPAQALSWIMRGLDAGRFDVGEVEWNA